MNGTVTAGFFSMFREISPKTTTYARQLLQWIIISTVLLDPWHNGTDLHLESSQSQEGTSATFTRAGPEIHSPQGYISKSH